MSISVLVFADQEATPEMVASKLCNYHIITPAMWQSLEDEVSTLSKAEFILSCGAKKKFVAFSKLWRKHDARAMFTIGKDSQFWIDALSTLPYQISRRWIHNEQMSQISDAFVYECVMTGNNVGTEFVAIRESDAEREQTHGAWGGYKTMVSIITSTFHSGKTKLARVVESLMSQTFNNWEWVVVDDSKQCPETRKMLKNLAKHDLRIKHYDLGHSGLIGEAKWRAANLSRGEWLVEVDHDDRILPSLLKTIVDIGIVNPDIGVVYSDFCTIGVDAKERESFRYFQTTTAFGAAGYICKFLRGQWHPWYLTQPINNVTLTDIVGVPNHVRSFKRKLYHEVNGFNYDMPIADDYDLMLRLFMSGAAWARIAEPLYLQYDNVGGDNFTNIRLTQIRALQAHVSAFYHASYQKRYAELSSPPLQFPTLLSGVEASNTGCYDFANQSRLKLEYTWQNGKLHRPNRSYEAARTVHKLMLKSKAVIPEGDRGKHNKIITALLKSLELSVVLMVNASTSLQDITQWLKVLLPIKNHVSIIGHPDSILRALQHSSATNDPDSKFVDVAMQLRHYAVWSFGLETGYYANGCEAWQTKKTSIVQHHLANYALKLTVCTGYVLYCDASVKPSAEISTIIGDIKDFDENENWASSLPLFGNIFTNLPKKEYGVCHGFFHHTTLPELYGYWQLDGTSSNEMTVLWKNGSRTLQEKLKTPLLS